jgi:hypothetical protein
LLVEFEGAAKRSKLENEAACISVIPADETSNVEAGKNKRGRDKEEALRDDVLQDITQEQRNRKAVKSGNAEIPEYLWEDQLLADLEGQEWDEAKLKKVRRVSGWLCTMMLRWWKKKVTTSYIAWAKDKYALTDMPSQRGLDARE